MSFSTIVLDDLVRRAATHLPDNAPENHPIRQVLTKAVDAYVLLEEGDIDLEDEIAEQYLDALDLFTLFELTAIHPPVQRDTGRVLRVFEVIHKTGYTVSSLYRLMAEGKFPKSVKLGARAVGWKERDIEKWLRERK